MQVKFQSTHSMKSATDIAHNGYLYTYGISIHALHEECDENLPESIDEFYLISIHALHEECDYSMDLYFDTTIYFNPRTP